MCGSKIWNITGRLCGVRRGSPGEESEATPREPALGEREEQALSDVRKGLSHQGGDRDPPGRGARGELAERHLSRVRQGTPASKNARSGEDVSVFTFV